MSEDLVKGNELLKQIPADYDGALEAFKRAASQGVKGADKAYQKALESKGEYINKLGDSLFKKKEFKEAVNYYRKSVEIMTEAGNQKRADNFQAELSKATEGLGQAINNEGDALMKKGSYKEAVEVYLKSVQLMEEAGNQKKLDNFQGELRGALGKRAQQLVDEGIKLAKDDKLEEALAKIKEAQTNAKLTGNDELMAKIEKNVLSVYESIADGTNARGDKAYADKKWTDAVELYKKSVTYIKKAGNQKKLDNFQKELAKAYQDHAQDINNAADKAFKDGDYETAIKVYSESVEAAKAGGNQKLVANFQAELTKSMAAFAQEVNTKGDALFAEKNFQEAAKAYAKSVELAGDAKNEKLKANFTAELRKTYVTWAQTLENEGNVLFKNADYEGAVTKYKKAVETIDVTGDKNLVAKYETNLIASYGRWGSNINAEGDNAFKMKDYEKAYKLYAKSVELAELSKDAKLVNNFRKERDKALSKTQ
jgi:tetratricopeptide (TPR) repeat protein